MVVLVPSLLVVVTGGGRALGSERSGSETSSAQSGRLRENKVSRLQDCVRGDTWVI